MYRNINSHWASVPDPSADMPEQDAASPGYKQLSASDLFQMLGAMFTQTAEDRAQLQRLIDLSIERNWRSVMTATRANAEHQVSQPGVFKTVIITRPSPSEIVTAYNQDLTLIVDGADTWLIPYQGATIIPLFDCTKFQLVTPSASPPPAGWALALEFTSRIYGPTVYNGL